MTRRLRKAMDERDQGFTLIELLVVIIIIGILAAIAIPVFLNQRKKGVDAGLKSDIKNAATAVETWSTDNPSTAPVDETVTGGAAGLTTGALNGFKTSPGNTVKLDGTGVGLYTICAFNAGATTSTTGAINTAIYYDSNAGGVMPTAKTTVC